MPTMKQLKAYLNRMVSDGDQAIQNFKAKLNNDPVNAFKWCDTVMSLTARQAVGQRFLKSINGWEELRAKGELSEGQPKTDEAAVDTVKTIIMREMLQKARWGTQSTSNGANIMERQEVAAYADMLGDFDMMYE